MHFHWRNASILTLLSLSTLTYATPSPRHGALVARASDTPELPPELQPQPQDDHITQAEPRKDLTDAPFNGKPEDYEDLPDYDPDQDTDDPDNTVAAAGKKSITNLLREIRVQGDRVRPRFIKYTDRKFVYVDWKKGEKGKDKPVSLFETHTEFPISDKDKGQPWKVWQADHVPDLGLFTTIARKQAPKDVSEKAWKAYTTAVSGDVDKDGKRSANKRTTVLGRILNDPVNIRGIYTSWNRNKMELMDYAYGEDKIDLKKVFKKYARSTVWGTYKMLLKTKPQFDESITKAAAAAGKFVENDDKSAKALEKFLVDETNKIRDTTIKAYEDALAKGPPEKEADSPFAQDDCNNTKDSPENTKDDTETVPQDTPAETGPTDTKTICVDTPTTAVRDAHEEHVKVAAAFFCREYAKDTVQEKVDIKQTVTWTVRAIAYSGVLAGADYKGDGKKAVDDVFDVSVTSVEGCKPDGGYHLAEPVKNFKCSDVLFDAWKKCYNQGRGGTITTGCLDYSFKTKF